MRELKCLIFPPIYRDALFGCFISESSKISKLKEFSFLPKYVLGRRRAYVNFK